MAQPRWHIRPSDHLTMQLDIAVQHVRGVHNLIDVEGIIGKNDSAVGTT